MMKPQEMPFQRYRPYPVVNLRDRTWPDQTITSAPIWCSVDLRDGNQALSIPMNIPEKLKMFALLVSMGFKEIEVGFPSASEIEFQFVRQLIEDGHIPDDVSIQVLTQARQKLIERTFESIRGATNAIVHVYNSTSTIQREVVFKKNRAQIKDIAIQGTRFIKSLTSSTPHTHIRLEYSPESFTATELEYALDVCNAVIAEWGPTSTDKVIINLPATVEMSTPNVYADRIEWFCRHVDQREAVIISVHTHNDRGTGVAASELALMAGADRVEGALFGNGERSGNMDIVIMALNLFSQGVDPQLNLSDINAIANVYRQCTRMDIHPRHPYVGDLVYTAFSGSHQDAINKGMTSHNQGAKDIWDVPYLPIDPKDVGRSYEALIRINSQSGKGGIAYIMEQEWGYKLPKDMQPEFAQMIQQQTEQSGKELYPQQIKAVFDKEYISANGRFQLISFDIHTHHQQQELTYVEVVIQSGQDQIVFSSSGNGPVDAFVAGLKENAQILFEVISYSEHALTKGSDAEAVAYIGLQTAEGPPVFGVGQDTSISTASIRAIVCALNRMEQISDKKRI